MNASEWYFQLIKPSFAPPSWLFGPVWSVLYLIIFLSFGYTVFLIAKGKLPKNILIPLSLNLVSNALFSPIQFVLRNNFLATLDILLVLGTLIWFFLIMLKKVRIVAYAQIPYIMWVSFATILQISITILNF